MDGLAVQQLQLGHGRTDGPGEVVVGDRPGAEGDPSCHPASGELPARGGDGDALNADLCHALGTLNSLGDRLGGFVDVDDRSVADPPGLDVGHAGSGQGPVDAPDSVWLHDEAGDLAGTEVHCGGDSLSPQGRLEAIPGLPTRFNHGHLKPPSSL